MRCDYFDAGECRSCTWMGQRYNHQLAAKLEYARTVLRDQPIAWAAPVASQESGFRNKAKMVVGGDLEQPTLGILDEHGLGVDLRHCGIHERALHDALPVLAEHVTRAGLTPYDVPTRRGELKHVLVTAAPSGELMVRWVLRSTEPVLRLRKHLPWLLEQLPVVVASANIQPEHKAVLEGAEEIVLTEAETLPMRLGDPGREVTLELRPQSFFQTNTAIATALYAEARGWVRELRVATVWDLYCGVGGFALHLAGEGREVLGVEISEEAVAGASRAALPGVRFVAGDATTWAARTDEPTPELVVVNPPRRGLGPDLAGWLEGSGVPYVLYSSCHVDSLARDLELMPSYAGRRGRVFDMFPQTMHQEVLVLLERR